MPLIPFFWLVPCLLIAYFGRNRKFGFWGYFIASVFLTPLIGLLLMLASDARPAKQD
jgi:uncharacterized membrane protein